MSKTLSPKTPEQSQEPEQPTKWDDLANPNESWEEHLEQAKELKDGELLSEDNKEPLFMGMKLGEAVEKLDVLEEQGANIDGLMLALTPELKLFYAEELSGRGIEIDEDALMEQIGEVDSQEIIKKLLAQGANVEKITNQLGLDGTLENFNLFSEYGIDLSRVINKNPYWSEEIYKNLDELLSRGLEIDLKKIGQNIATIKYQDIDKFSEAGLSIEEIVSKLKPEEIFTNFESLIAKGANAESLVAKMSPEDIEKNFEKIAAQCNDINKLATLYGDRMPDFTSKFNYFIAKGADAKKIWGYLTPEATLQRLDMLRKNGIDLDINVDQPKEEIERDYHFCRAEWDLSRGDFRGARADLTEGVYGVRLGSLCKEMVAFGAVDFTDEDRKEMRGAYTTTEDFYEKEFSRMGGLKMTNLNELNDSAQINVDDAALIAGALKLMCANDEKIDQELDFYKNIKQSLRGTRMGEVLAQIRNNLCEKSAREYSKYMTEHIEQGARALGTLPYEYEIKEGEFIHKDIPVMKMEGEEWMMLVHRLGAIYGKSNEAFEHPEKWDTREVRLDSYGQPTGYVSTSAIGDQSLDLAGGPKEESLLYYGFTNLDDKAFLHSAEYDLYTRYNSIDSKVGVDRQDFFYTNPRTIVEKTRDRLNEGGKTEGYNEIVLDRYPGKDSSKRIHPNYLIVFSDSPNDIQEAVKKHAAYFGVPIMLIDPNKYGRSKK